MHNGVMAIKPARTLRTTPWPYATVVFVAMLLRGIADPTSGGDSQYLMVGGLGFAFIVSMVIVGMLCGWLGRQRAVLARLTEWSLVLGVAWFGALIVGYLAVVDGFFHYTNWSERLTMIGAGLLGWIGGAWIGLRSTGRRDASASALGQTD